MSQNDVKPEHLAPLLERFQVNPDDLNVIGMGGRGSGQPGHALAQLDTGDPAVEQGAIETILTSSDPLLGPDGVLLVWTAGGFDEMTLSRWRNDLWPRQHLTAIARIKDGSISLRTLQGVEQLSGSTGDNAQLDATVLVCRRKSWVLSPDFTVEKFDQNAASWNGNPGSSGYGHFRWMRRLVGTIARPKRGQRVLDFGCGAGWCGIEAVKGIDDITLCAFDPSPAMVQIARDNAAAEGVKNFEGRTGFGSNPPFPAEGEAPFDLVISSGVVSFAPDFEAFFDGLQKSMGKGATLVIGDINANSRGMRARRPSRALLPVRELNARTAAEVKGELQSRGFTHHETFGYQLTTPMPQAMHVSDAKLGGILSAPLLMVNRAMAALDRRMNNGLGSQFDSWVMHLTAPN